jgi:hypothetical protein
VRAGVRRGGGFKNRWDGRRAADRGAGRVRRCTRARAAARWAAARAARTRATCCAARKQPERAAAQPARRAARRASHEPHVRASAAHSTAPKPRCRSPPRAARRTHAASSITPRKGATQDALGVRLPQQSHGGSDRRVGVAAPLRHRLARDAVHGGRVEHVLTLVPNAEVERCNAGATGRRRETRKRSVSACARCERDRKRASSAAGWMHAAPCVRTQQHRQHGAQQAGARHSGGQAREKGR